MTDADASAPTFGPWPGGLALEAGAVVITQATDNGAGTQLTPLRPGDVRSLVDTLERAMSYPQAIDPIWGGLLTLAREELDPS